MYYESYKNSPNGDAAGAGAAAAAAAAGKWTGGIITMTTLTAVALLVLAVGFLYKILTQ